MTEAHKEIIFTVSNNHSADCGRPPKVDGDAPRKYHGYFKNRSGEQFIFVYDFDSEEGTLWGGDLNWEKSYPVLRGRVPAILLQPEEQAWLRACWETCSPGTFLELG